MNHALARRGGVFGKGLAMVKSKVRSPANQSAKTVGNVIEARAQVDRVTA